LERRRRLRIERAFFGIGNLLEPRNRLLVVLLGLEKLGFDRLRTRRAARLTRRRRLPAEAGGLESYERREEQRGGRGKPRPCRCRPAGTAGAKSALDAVPCLRPRLQRRQSARGGPYAPQVVDHRLTFGACGKMLAYLHSRGLRQRVVASSRVV